MKVKFFLTNLTCIFILPLYAFAWDGPSQGPGSGLAGLFRPTSFVDISTELVGGPSAIEDSRLRTSSVIYGNEKETWQASTRVYRLRLNEDIPLSSSGVATPRELWTFNLGGSYDRKLEGGNNVGVILSGGSNSDKPFHSIHEMDLQATTTYVQKVDPLHYWIFLLNYSSSRTFAPGVPLPGVAYFSINPQTKTQVSYGIPFFVGWQPDPKWSLRFVYIIPTNVNLDVTYEISKPYKLHAGFEWLSQSWMRANRPNSAERIIFERKRLDAGLKAGLGDDWFFDFRGGWVFDQRIFEAQSILTRNVRDSYLAAGPFVLLEVARKF